MCQISCLPNCTIVMVMLTDKLASFKKNSFVWYTNMTTSSFDLNPALDWEHMPYKKDASSSVGYWQQYIGNRIKRRSNTMRCYFSGNHMSPWRRIQRKIYVTYFILPFSDFGETNFQNSVDTGKCPSSCLSPQALFGKWWYGGKTGAQGMMVSSDSITPCEPCTIIPIQRFSLECH